MTSKMDSAVRHDNSRVWRNKWRRAEALEQDGLIDVRSHDLRAPLLGRCLVKHVVAHADLERKLHLRVDQDGQS
jgi:hypothetical protein